MSRYFTHPISGKLSLRPWYKEQALEHNHPSYISEDRCQNPQCADGNNPFTGYGRYVATDVCISCLVWDQLAINNYFQTKNLWNVDEWTVDPYRKGHTQPNDELTVLIFEVEALMQESPGTLTVPLTPCKKGGHVRVMKGSKCLLCEHEKQSKKLTPRQVALNNDAMWYIPETPCTTCNTISPKRVNNGECKGCVEMGKDVSPRQMAIRNGDTWYMPEIPCQKCNTLSMKRTHDGRCQGCNPIVRPSVAKI